MKLQFNFFWYIFIESYEKNVFLIFIVTSPIWLFFLVFCKRPNIRSRRFFKIMYNQVKIYNYLPHNMNKFCMRQYIYIVSYNFIYIFKWMNPSKQQKKKCQNFRVMCTKFEIQMLLSIHLVLLDNNYMFNDDFLFEASSWNNYSW